jgi:hypothetical protein
MTLSVSKCIEIELIRDGGSFVATFESANASKNLLLLKLIPNLEILTNVAQYDEPVIIDADPTKRPSDTGGLVHSSMSGPSIPCSWVDALALLRQIEALEDGLSLAESEKLQKMIKIVKNNGRVINREHS